MGCAYLCFLFQLQKRDINDKGEGGICVSVCQA